MLYMLRDQASISSLRLPIPVSLAHDEMAAARGPVRIKRGAGAAKATAPPALQLRELRAILAQLERFVARYRWALDRLAAGDDPNTIAEEWARLMAAMAHASGCTAAQQRELRAILAQLERFVARYRWALDRLAAGDDPNTVAEEWARLRAAMEEGWTTQKGYRNRI